MKYEFPVIQHINDVLPIVKDRKEFIVADKGDYTVINYVVMGNDTFPDVIDYGYKMGGPRDKSEYINKVHHDHAILRECRGLIFDKSGKILSRRFHKFFNVNERVETEQNKLPLDTVKYIFEKLDGSMITPLVINGVVRWGTKMGITETSKQVEVWIAEHNHTNYVAFAEWCHNLGYTPIFEWCSRKNRIVIDYPEDDLILLAIRHNESGAYMGYPDMCYYAENHGEGIPVVKVYGTEIGDMEKFITDTRGLEDAEGYVIRFADGHMVKVKGEWYCNLHRVKDEISNPRLIIQHIINGTLDDVKSFCLEADREYLDRFEKMFNDFWKDEKVLTIVQFYRILADVHDIQYKTGDNERKIFAEIINEEVLPIYRPIFFKLMDQAENREVLDIDKIIKQWITKFLTKNSKFDENEEHVVSGDLMKLYKERG